MKQEIKEELKEIGSSLADVQAGMPYAVPEGYFAAFAAGVDELVAADDNIIIGKSLPYNVPGNYFDSLPKQIAESVTKEKPKGIVISFRQLRWAAAAVLFIAIGLGSYNMFTGAGNVGKDGLLASVPDKDIREYLVYDHAGMVKTVNNDALEKIDLDRKEIIAYLDETGWGTDSY